VKLLSSIQNPEIKHLRLLFDKAKIRKKEKLFVIEGEREIGRALAGGYTVQKYFFHEALPPEKRDYYSELDPSSFSYILEAHLFDKIGYRSGTEKMIAVAEAKSHALSDLKLKDNALILVIEAPEKPGNIGALLRTAAAADFDAVIIANPKTDLYNPNSIRASVGGIFRMPIALDQSKAVITYLLDHEIFIATAALKEGALPYHEFEFKTPCALVMGTEDTGLHDDWLENTHQNIIIPMSEKVDSLNLSVSAGILMYEAKKKNYNLNSTNID